MGFELLDINTNFDLNELQQNINLSFKAAKTIKNDLLEFSSNYEEIAFSYFLNKIIENFVDDAESSINTRVYYYEIDIKNKLKANKIKNEKKVIVDFLLDDFKKTLINKFNERLKRKKYKFPGFPSKFRINSKNIKKLNSINEPYASDGSISIGNYLKVLFEEYADLPKYKREEIYFAEYFSTINSAIKQNKAIKIYVNNCTLKQNSVILCKPYKIVHDDLLARNYIACYSQIIVNNEHGYWSESKMSSIRISRIGSINIQNSVSNFISKKDIEALDTAIEERGIEFLIGEQTKINVTFDFEGFKLFKNLFFLKPYYYLKRDDGSYDFYCTERQMQLYFSSFGDHIKIKK